MVQSRRNFIKQAAAVSAMPLITSLTEVFGSGAKKPVILLRSSWQTINIGDIGHTPGVLSLLEKHLPQAEVRLWASDVGDGVDTMLKRRFPDLEIIFSANKELLAKAFKESDFLLHGSGPYLVASNDIEVWNRETGNKPYGVYGITMFAERITDKVVELLTKARFVFFRDTVSMQFAKDKGVVCPVMQFGPDGAFAVDLRNDAAALQFLQEHNLEKGKYVCVIPRYRQTPAWTIPSKNFPFNKEKNARNETMKEHDHKPLRDAIIAVIRQTKMKILICPEDVTQIGLGKNLLLDLLPDDVKPRVVWRNKFWLTDEAISTYVLSAGLFGLEMHSPIMCIGNGVPAIVCRFEEQTSKGYMWKDIGLEEWLFDFDKESDLDKLVPAVLSMITQPEMTKKKVKTAHETVMRSQVKTMKELKKHLKHTGN